METKEDISRVRDYSFPADFIWGTATSSHQVEGGNTFNDWYEFEQIEGNIKNNDKSGKACNHYELYEADFDLAKSMCNNAHRFSIEWSRVEPEAGRFNQKEIDHYSRVLDALNTRGLAPFVTLHHFTSPKWFTDMGGFLNKDSINFFVRYVGKIARSFGNRVSRWMTFNEPQVLIVNGYWRGTFPPGHTNFFEVLEATNNVLEAHAGAYCEIKKTVGDDERVGLVNASTIFYPFRIESRLDTLLTELVDHLWNGVYLKAVKTGEIELPGQENRYVPGLKASADFLGVNYYHYIKIDARKKQPFSDCFSEEDRTDMNWPVLIRTLSKDV
ncbi:MAG: family 1 glycosylhydrolase [Spirochaetota bacterium]